METNFTTARLLTDTRSQELIDHLIGAEDELGIIDGVVYYDFPLFRDTDDVLYRSKVLLASRSHGLALFSVPDISDRTMSEGRVLEVDSELAQLHSIIYGKLLKSRILRRSLREIKVPISTHLVLTDISEAKATTLELESQPIFSLNSVDASLTSRAITEPLSDEEWNELRSILEGAKGLVRPKDRDLEDQDDNSKGAILKDLETEIANFDANQRRAAITIVDGPQRIRGLAGSGKTIVLAMKAAHIHLNDPSATILLTFYTKSLYDTLKRLVTRFYRQFNDQDPNWDKVHIRHAWGGRSVDGVYYSACVENGISPLTLSDVIRTAPDPFASVCQQLLDTQRVKPKYDYVLIDEAQDFPAPFYRLCFELTKGNKYDRNVIWAYDELQNIVNVRIRSPKETFGTDVRGVALMDLDRTANQSRFGLNHDIVLYKCYRNPREVLVCAHAIGFGVYSDTVVQMLENKEHWEDVGYIVEQGDCHPGEHTVILRPAENSPLSISERQTPQEIIACYLADDFSTEVSWVVESIRSFIAEGLRADDIMVIALDDRNARAYLQAIAEGLGKSGIQSNDVLSNPYSEPAFLLDDHVTLTTVYRAKGNEAAVVFATGMDAIYPARRHRRGRNKLFTAFTRAKAWLRVSGIGSQAEFFLREIETARSKVPLMEFEYPDPQEVHTHQRDLTDKAAKLRKLREEMERQFEQLELDEEDKVTFVAGLQPKKR